MSSITWNPATAKIENNSQNTFIVGRPGKGQKLYLDENSNTVENKVEDKVEEDE